jgi:hypothetical protein
LQEFINFLSMEFEMKRIILSLLILPLILIAQIPDKFTWQGIIADDEGTLLDGSYGVVLSLYMVQSGSQPIWTETQTIDISNGYANIVLGDVNPIDLSFDTQYWLEISIEEGEPLSRIPLYAVPYALYANTDAWKLKGNEGTEPGVNFIGTKDSVDLSIRTNNELKARITTKGQLEFYNNAQSVLIGEQAGENMRIGYMNDNNNVLIGYQSGMNISEGTNNTAIGYQTLFSGNWASMNTAVGSLAQYSMTSGGGNSSLGTYALFNNTTGQSNTAIGQFTLYMNQEGSDNIALGPNALYNTMSYNNIGIGPWTMYSNKVGSNNIAIGTYANHQSDSGSYNIAIGYMSLTKNKGINNIIAIGKEALYNNSMNKSEIWHSQNNIAIGEQALYSNTTGYGNLAFGYMSLYENTTGDNNSAYGLNSLHENIDGMFNTAIGRSAMYNNDYGNYNTGIGSNALYNNTSGDYNIALGYYSLNGNTTGDYNIGIGWEALPIITDGTNNIAIGTESMLFLEEGNSNVALGEKSLRGFVSGSNNTAVGTRAGYLQDTLNDCTLLGYWAYAYYNVSNSTALGALAKVDADNQVRIGNSSVTSIGGYEDWTNISDERFKLNIQENIPGIDFITQLRPVTYNLDVDGLNNALNIPDSLISDAINQKAINNKKSITYSGFLAQEVEQTANELGFQFSGVDAPQNENGFYGLRYATFVVPLVKAVQEQQEIINEQNDKIEELEAKYNKILELINQKE